MTDLRDEFLSEEDLDLRNLTDEELTAYWNQWLEQAQATNAADAHTYSHGVFTCTPQAKRMSLVAEDVATYGNHQSAMCLSVKSGCRRGN